MAPLNMLRLTILIAALSFVAIAQADYTGPFTETWSDDGDLKGWAGYNTEITHDDVYDRLLWSGALQGDNVGVLYADASNSPSDMHYFGDLTGASNISFDWGIDAGTNVNAIFLQFGNVDSDSFWNYELGTPVIGETSYTVTFDDPGWAGSLNSVTMEETLTNVNQWAFVWNWTDSTDADTASGYLDNFGISEDDAGPAVPEPGTMTLVMLGLGSLGYLRRRKASTK